MGATAVVVKDPIIITGCARSGTSLTAGMLAACGAEFGDTYDGTEDNIKGFFEHKQIREHIIKAYLRSLGADPMGQDPLPSKTGLAPYPSLKEKVLGVFNPESNHWAVKGAKICLMWEAWRAAFPKAHWIIVRRNREDIISSCMQTKFMRAYNTREEWAPWVSSHEERFLTIHCSVRSSTMFWPELVLKGNWDYLKSMVEWCGLRWNEEKVKAFVDPKLWRTFA